MTVIGSPFGGAGVTPISAVTNMGYGYAAPAYNPAISGGIKPNLPALTTGTARMYQAAGINPSSILAQGDPSILAYQMSPNARTEYLATDFQNVDKGFDQLMGMGNMQAMEANYNLQSMAYQNYLRTGIYGVDPFVAANTMAGVINNAGSQIQSLAKQTTAGAKSMLSALQDAVKQTTPVYKS